MTNENVFWAIVNLIKEGPGIFIRDDRGEVTELGMELSSKSFITYSYDRGTWNFYAHDNKIGEFDEKSVIVVTLIDLFQELQKEVS